MWGKVNVVKITVAPHFNYLVMMLPITILPDIFKRYDNIIKHFLWEGKKARIKLSKVCAPTEKGRMGLPDPRLYYLAFEMSKLAIYWEETGDTVD